MTMRTRNRPKDGRPLTCRVFVAGLLLASASSTWAALRYVDVNSTNATRPYITWATAAQTIQDAVDAAVAGDEIVVTNGIYVTGGRAIPGNPTTNRVVVDKAVNVRSVNGPGFTAIHGATTGSGIRCVYLTNYATLSGFTLTHGLAQFGGGLWCQSTNSVASNCVVSGNRAFTTSPQLLGAGGGAYGGTLNHCTLSANSAASGGGAAWATLNDCILSDNRASAGMVLVFPHWQAGYIGRGGGAADCTLNNCTLTSNGVSGIIVNGVYPGAGGGAAGGILKNCSLRDNWASGLLSYGGGASSGTLNNCALSGNSSELDGGGAAECVLNNCTLTRNSAANSGGGVAGCTLNNCIVYYNTSPNAANYDGEFSNLNYSCTTPQPANGVGNITNAPLFADLAAGNLRLQFNSACIDAGLNAFAPAGPDLDGNRRIVGRGVDMGAFEFQSLSSISHGKDNRAPEVPLALELPADENKVHFQAYAAGVQIYAWNGTAWVFQGPEAVLYADMGAHSEIGIHYAGPTWENQSGGKVVGAAIANAPSPNTNSIPLLLIRAISNEGPGLFARTTFIQRVNTVGGRAPASAGTTTGQIARVPYTAEYFFYRAAK